jgi:hypothetical protein
LSSYKRNTIKPAPRQPPASGTTEGACSRSLGRRRLKSSRVEAFALGQEFFTIDALCQALNVASYYAGLCKVSLPSIHNFNDSENIGRGFCRQQTECIALRHCVFERRVSALRATYKLLVSLSRIGGQDVICWRQFQAAMLERIYDQQGMVLLVVIRVVDQDVENHASEEFACVPLIDIVLGDANPAKNAR